MEQCTEVNMNKVVIKILQGSVVTQTVLGGLTRSLYIFQLQISYTVCAKNYESWLAKDEVIATFIRGSFIGPRCLITLPWFAE